MKPLPRLRAALLVLVALSILPSMAQDYVQHMPSPEQVAAQVRGTDALDGKARQAGAMRALCTMVSQVFSPSGLFEATAAEKALMKRYADAGNAVEQRTLEELKQQGPDAPKAWWNKVLAYEQDPALRDELLAMLPADMRTQYRDRMAGREQERVADSIARVAYDAEQDRAMQAQIDRLQHPLAMDSSVARDAWLNHWWLLVLGLLCLAGAVLGVVRELRPSGMDPEHPGYYRVGFARYELGSFIGTAAGTSYITSATRHSGRDHNDRPYSYTTSTEHQRFHLVAANGDQIPVHRINSSIGVIDGNLVGVIVLNVKNRVHELAYHNYSTNLLYVQPSFITAFNSTALFAAGAAVFLLIAFYLSGAVSFLGDAAPYTLGVIGALPVMLVYLIFGWMRAKQRQRQLRDEVLPPLFRTLREKGTIE